MACARTVRPALIGATQTRSERLESARMRPQVVGALNSKPNFARRELSGSGNAAGR